MGFLLEPAAARSAGSALPWRERRDSARAVASGAALDTAHRSANPSTIVITSAGLARRSRRYGRAGATAAVGELPVADRASEVGTARRGGVEVRPSAPDPARQPAAEAPDRAGDYRLLRPLRLQ